ncbi:O-antigen ligase family protein [Sphingomonas gei]|uniref:O-antigen ligase family protein n=1 Tax=Sphingomonas gei TaxID=1395960 RepID=UPI001441AAE5|nr:O-antigen ligase family protein [Sphingomonas gei]
MASVIMLAVALFLSSGRDLARVKFPLLFLGSLTALMIIQSIPLPPFIWTALPGRELFASGASILGVEQPWRPISLAPDATLNSILSTLPGFAALVGLASFPKARMSWLLALVIGLTMVSATMGVLQISSGELYLFDITNRGSSVGFFANRNHHAALLTAVLPALAALAIYPSDRLVQLRLPLACALALFLVPMVLITGSRAGLLLLLVGLAGAMMLVRPAWRTRNGAPAAVQSFLASRLGKASTFGFAIVLIAIVVTSIVLSRALAIQRLFAQDVEADTRLRLFGVLVDMTKNYFPVGSGFGSFPVVFKIVEPDWYLGPSYFNHAHNDILEVLIEGGGASLALGLGFLIWAIRASIRIWRPVRQLEGAILLGRMGSLQVLMLVLASIADYPLRTPLNQVLFVIGCGLMALASEAVKRAGPERPEAPNRRVSPRVAG